MIEIDFESKTQRVFNISRNCFGYVCDSPTSEVRRSIDDGGARVRFEDEEIFVVTCPKFAGLDSHVCMFPGYNSGARKHLCSDGHHVNCATYNRSIGQ